MLSPGNVHTHAARTALQLAVTLAHDAHMAHTRGMPAFALPTRTSSPLSPHKGQRAVTGVRSRATESVQRSLGIAVSLVLLVAGLSGRVQLSGIFIPFIDVQRLAKPDSESSKVIHYAKSPMLGDVLEVKTTDEVIHRKALHLIHPWITALLDQEVSHDPESDLELHALRLVRPRQKFEALLLSRESRAQ